MTRTRGRGAGCRGSRPRRTSGNGTAWSPGWLRGAGSFFWWSATRFRAGKREPFARAELLARVPRLRRRSLPEDSALPGRRAAGRGGVGPGHLAAGPALLPAHTSQAHGERAAGTAPLLSAGLPSLVPASRCLPRRGHPGCPNRCRPPAASQESRWGLAARICSLRLPWGPAFLTESSFPKPRGLSRRRTPLRSACPERDAAAQPGPRWCRRMGAAGPGAGGSDLGSSPSRFQAGPRGTVRSQTSRPLNLALVPPPETASRPETPWASPRPAACRPKRVGGGMGPGSLGGCWHPGEVLGGAPGCPEQEPPAGCLGAAARKPRVLPPAPGGERRRRGLAVG